MSDDMELLGLAARAIGFDDANWDNKANAICTTKLPGFRCFWNPLTDDGDALQLAVGLQMTLSLGPCEVSASTIDGVLNNRWFKHEIIETNSHAATRRVIVLAAADMARRARG